MKEITGYELCPVDRVNTTIKNGWQPYGSPFIGVDGAIYQAIVKYKED